jgi:hypothetical protein
VWLVVFISTFIKYKGRKKPPFMRQRALCSTGRRVDASIVHCADFTGFENYGAAAAAA